MEQVSSAAAASTSARCTSSAWFRRARWLAGAAGSGPVSCMPVHSSSTAAISDCSTKICNITSQDTIKNSRTAASLHEHLRIKQHKGCSARYVQDHTQIHDKHFCHAMMGCVNCCFRHLVLVNMHLQLSCSYPIQEYSQEKCNQEFRTGNRVLSLHCSVSSHLPPSRGFISSI